MLFKKNDFANKINKVTDISDKAPSVGEEAGMGREIKLIIAFFVVFGLVVAFVLVAKYEFAVTNVRVYGNEHYTAREIENMVMSGKYGHNSIYLYLKYYNGSVKDIPFIEQMDIELDSPTSVTIRVYEKAVAGYVEYLGHYLYFDKDGIVVESSTEQMEGIPFVTGLKFDHVLLHEELPVENQNIFKLILNITQLLTKYSIATDKIYFDQSENITLYFGDSRVYLGTSDYIDEKINRLQYLLPNMDGMAGVLYMDTYKGEGGKFTFEKDDDIILDEENGEEDSDSEENAEADTGESDE